MSRNSSASAWLLTALLLPGLFLLVSAVGNALDGRSGPRPGADDAARASRIVHSCLNEPSGRAALVAALWTVEDFGRRGPEHLIETFLIAPLAGLGIPIGDFSVGPLQIRPSTALAAAPSSGRTSRAQAYVDLTSDGCRSVAVADAYIAQLMAPCLAKDDANRSWEDCAVAALRAYNGQKTYSPSNLLYLSITMSIYRYVAALTKAGDTDTLARF